MKRQSRGIALVLVLSVLVLLLIITLSVSTRGIGTLSQVKGLGASYRSVGAAEAAVSVGLNAIVTDRTFAVGFAEQKYVEDTLYGLEVVNNSLGGTTVLTASNGMQVKPGYVYLLGSGQRGDGAFKRQAAALIKPTTGSSLPFALGAGGGIILKQHTTIKGSLKSSGDIDLRSQTDVQPLNGSGRLLSGGSIDTKGPTHMDASQDARAAGKVGHNLRGTENVVENDTSADTKAFINDGRTTGELQPGEEGTVLPYPDFKQLLEVGADGLPGANIAQHAETSFSGQLDLNGQTHFFPNGVTFTSGADITGTGTLVVGNGNSVLFQCPLGDGSDADDDSKGNCGNKGTTNPPLKMNVLALFPDNGGKPDLATGTPDITFDGYTNIEGLVLAGHSVKTDRKARITGQIIAYKGDIVGEMRDIFTMMPEVMGGVTGLGGFATGADTPSGPVTVLSWQRF
jgi:hypothetical protein